MRCTAPKIIIVSIIALFYSGLPLHAQEDSTCRTDIGRFVDGAYHNLSGPLRWQRRDWATTAILLASTAAVSSLDQPVNRFWIGKQDPVLDVVNDVGYWYGYPASGFILTGGFYLSGIVFKNEWARETGVILGTAFATSTLLVSVLKPVVGRTRPGNGTNNLNFHPFSREAKFHSFPSGHSAIAFTLSFVLAKRINNKPLKIFFYTLAASTAFCRLYSNAHWLSDVYLGGTIAWVSTTGSIKRLSTNRFKALRNTHVSLRPNIGGMTLRISFN